MQIKPGQLVKMGCSQANESLYIDSLNTAFAKYNINTYLRICAFISQVLHESGMLSTAQENLNYGTAGLLATFPSHFSGQADAANYNRQPIKIGCRVYCNRMGNGSEASGDGYLYLGRGLVQISGKSNYNSCSQGLGVDFVGKPELLAIPQYAALSAAWFWNSKSLNDYADRKDTTSITQRINGGQNGAADRNALYQKALIVFADGSPTEPVVPPTNPPTTTTPPANTSPITEKKSPSAAKGNVAELVPNSTSLYPWNKVEESRSGHIIEVDDTPGAERLNMTHRTGSYWEMNPLGTYTMKSVLDMYSLVKEDLYGYVGGDYTQQVLGQSYRYTAGDNVLKSDGTIYLDSNRVQVNTGMMAVTGEINAPSINAEVFTGPFADVLAKESMLAWDLGHGGGGGSAPAMINNSLGFMGNSGSESLLTNKLATHSPSGTPIITNGIPPNTVIDPSATTSTAASDTATPLANATGVSIFSGNAISAAAAAIDAAAILAGNNTPVFIKHVSFDKPILPSQSTVAALPIPSLHTNNLHTIVNPTTGVGELNMSDGTNWNPVGSGTASQAIILGIVNSTVGTATADQLAAEQVARNQAILNEAIARQQAISAGLLTEAQARGAAIIAESTIRQSAEQSLSDHIITLTASTGANASAIQQEQTARTSGDSANATATQTVAATAATNTASIISNATVAANASSALGTRIDALTVTTGQNTSAISTETTARTTADTAIGSRIDVVISNVATNTASIISNATTAANASSANATLISSLTTTVNGNTATISTQQTSINGVSANYGVKINANGAVSGFGLLSTTVGSTPISKFTIQADSFSLINPAGGSTAVAPFTVTAGGNLSISGNLNGVGGTFIGTVSAGTILGGAYTGYGWPAAGSGGYFIGPQGILIGNYNGGGNYFQYDQAAGTIAMPGLYISGGNATFTGNISGGGGTFAGSLTAAGIITTGNVAANAITQLAVVSSSTYSIVSATLTMSGSPVQIICLSNAGGTLTRDGVSVGLNGNTGTQVAIDYPSTGQHTYTFQEGTGSPGVTVTFLEAKR